VAPEEAAAPAAFEATRAAALGAAVDALAEVPLLGFGSAEQLFRLQELQRRAASLGAFPAAKTDSTPATLDQLARLVAEAERALVEELHEYGSTSFSGFFNLWESTLDIRLGPADGTCPYCGRLLSRMRGTHFLYREVVRDARLCHRCGPVLDLPVGSRISDLRLSCPPVWQRPGDVDVDVFIDPTDGGASGSGWLSVHLSGAALIGVEGPPPREVNVGRNPVAVRCRLRLTATALPHQVFARALVLLDGQIHYASRTSTIEPVAPGAVSTSDEERSTHG
jgi:hypothetical protein